MKRAQLASAALAEWTLQALREGERSISQQQLPDIDVRAFLRSFAVAEGIPKRVSLALVGFGVDAQEIQKLAEKVDAKCFTRFAADLHVAARWRNDRARHPVIIAYARGTVTGVNTLRHFSQANSRDLTVTLLKWASAQKAFSNTAAHTRLLTELQTMIEEGDTFSFEQVRTFLEEWDGNAGPGAPRNALFALGLLPDANLFADGTLIRARLERNVQFMEALRDHSVGYMEGIRKRLATSSTAPKARAELRARLKTFGKLQAIRRDPSPGNLSAISLDEGLRVFAAPSKPEAGPSPRVDDDHSQRESEVRSLNEKRLQKVSTELLLDDRDEELMRNATALSSALRSALDQGEGGGDTDRWEGTVEVDGESRTVEAEVDRRFVGWVRHFCTPETWGGLVETTVPDLRRALEDFDRPETQLLVPEHLLRVRGEELGMAKLLAGWDEELGSESDRSLGYADRWAEMKRLRAGLLDSLVELTHFPLEWFAGKPDVRSAAQDYLRTTGQLFGMVAKSYGTMAQRDPNWAKTTLEGLLSLDVVQVRVGQPDGKTASKAVLLPTHPLHLWRYWRLSTLLRGLGRELAEADRFAVVQEAGEPVQFLTVIYASPLPGGRGAGQVLPVANDLHRLATFENLRNAYSGPDGQRSLVYSVERFAAAHRQHVDPLRLVLVNPPQAGALLLDLLRLLDGRKRSFVPRLRVDVFGTSAQAGRLREALLFDTKEREIIEEKVASGRLDLRVDRMPRPLEEILGKLKSHPAHIVAVFDEAPVSVRRGGAGERLPMSPFCVRRRVAFHKRWNELRLEPTTGDPPFFEFIELVKHVEGNEGEGTPYAWPEAEALRKSVDDVLIPDDFGAQWFFLADRALPEEGEMEAQRLVRRREGQRQVLLATRDYEALAQLMLPVFEEDTPNLLMPVARLKELLGEGAHLVGAGLLDVVKSQEGRVDPARVIGLMGALLAARDYARRHPGALLVSTDSQLARTWLRLGIQADRCDLFAVREEGAQVIVECIEVKTTKGRPRPHTDTELTRAKAQVLATLAAVRDGLGDTVVAESQGHYLSAPRNEMLKEVLVQGCMGRSATREERSRWSGWLERLFGSSPEMPALRGVLIDVALGSAEEVRSEDFVEDGLTVRLTHLNEIDVQRLLDPLGGAGSEDRAVEVSDDVAPDTQVSAAVILDRSRAGSGTAESTFVERRSGPDPVEPERSAIAEWPPSPNVFGLIGQEAAATKLYNKAELARGTGRRFTDTLFIGPAGVGKSSLARAVASQLLAEDPIFFSGSDLPQPSALIEKLRERKKVPTRAKGRVNVGRCLVFIDEVHALAKPTVTALLSAMDDARVATIGGVEYNFAEVVFIAATTDKGLLSEAFVSRMDLIPLAAYTLEQLAGIIHYHAQKLFGGHDLPREVCIELAARSRGNPRRAVRSLENDLLAEFYSRLTRTQRKDKKPERAAAALMTVDAVGAYFDSHGVDLNGLDELGRKTLGYLKTHGATPEDRICKGLRISNRQDFVELIEYLSRLGLVSTGHQGRQLTSDGRRYLSEPTDLRGRI